MGVGSTLLDIDADYLEGLEARLPFHAYSSANKKNNKPHKAVLARQDAVLNLWWRRYSVLEIAVRTMLDIDTVRSYVREARRDGDPRAGSRMDWNRMRGAVTRHKIALYSKRGFDADEIADMLDVSKRLVQMRLAESR